MPKKTHFGTLMDKQHAKGSETLLKSSPQYFCHIERISARKIPFQ